MLNVTVTFNGAKEAIAKLEKARRGLGERALRSAVNKVADQSRTQMSRAIREEYAISAQLVNQRLSVRRATNRPGAATFSAVLIGNPVTGGAKRSMNLIHFLERKVTLAEAKRRRKDGTLSELRFRIKKRGKPAMIKGAFIGNDGRTVFIREGAARLPIKAVRTIGVPQMFATKRNVGKVTAFIRQTFPRVLQHEIAHFLRSVR